MVSRRPTLYTFCKFVLLLFFAFNFVFCDLWNSVLPKFSVELSVPPYILKTDENITDIKVKIMAR